MSIPKPHKKQPSRSCAMGISKLLALLVLASCTQCPAPSYVSACPPLVKYTPQFEQSAADQLATIPDGSPISTMLIDYGNLRQAVRTCQK